MKKRVEIVGGIAAGVYVLVGVGALFTDGVVQAALVVALIAVGMALTGFIGHLVLEMVGRLERLEMMESESYRMRAQLAQLQREGKERAEQAAELELLTKLLRRLAESRDVRDIAQVLLDESLAFLRASAGKVFVRADTNRMDLLLSVPPEEGAATSVSIGRGMGMVSEVAATGDPLLAGSRGERPISERERQTTMESAMCVPILWQGRVEGVILIEERVGGAFSQKDLKTLSLIAQQAGIALERAKLYSQLQIFSITDGLTGVANRRHLEKRLEEELSRAQRHHYPVSAIMLDIDHFKQINDTYGHLVGDEVLKALGSILSQNARRSDIVGRYGGEEFVVIIPHINTDEAVVFAERLRKVVSEHEFHSDEGQPFQVTISLGVATFPQHAAAERELMDAADEALYQAKQGGRNRVCVYAGAPKTPAGASGM